MVYGIISDIHSNKEALEAVLESLSKEKIDKYICVGDIVGYGPDPKDCIEKVRMLGMGAVLGNHDGGCTGFTNLSYFNSYAKDAIIWTMPLLSKSDLQYFKDLKIVEKMDDFTFTHGTLADPQDFNYMLDTHRALESFNIMDTRILFVGHSHVPGIFEYKNNNLNYFYKEKIRLSKDSKYIVNAGSVGQPRDGDNRASFVIYNTSQNEILIKRAKYDIKKTQDKMLKVGLPSILAERLSSGT